MIRDNPCKSVAPSIRRVRTGKLRADTRRRLQQRIQGLKLRQLRSAPGERLDHFLSRKVAHQCVLRKRTPTQAAQRRIKAAATCVVSGKNLFRGLLGTAVQVRTDSEIV